MSRRRRLQFVATMFLMLLGAVAELLTIGAVLPLLALAADPSYFDRFPAARAVFDLVGARPGDNLIIPAAMFLVSAAVVSAAVRSALTWTSYRFIFGLAQDMAMRVYSSLLYQPYENYVRQNSSAAIAAVDKIHNVATGILSSGLMAFTSAIISLCIITFLFMIDPVTAAMAIATLGLMYVALSLVAKRALTTTSLRMAQVRTERFQGVQESWGGMRDILLDRSQPIYERKLAGYENENRRLLANSHFIVEAPRFTVESFGIIVVAMLAVYFSMQPGGVLAAIPVLGALALGAQRLLPLVQTVYRGWASYSIHAASLSDLLGIIHAPVDRSPAPAGPDPFPAKVDIELDNIGFNYSSDHPVLTGITLTIPAGERVAFIGKTGSGKSTLVDLVMGLLTPTAGDMRLGGVRVDRANVRHWQARIAHVPQAIFLSDDSIAANIAFGSSDGELDMERVLDAAQRADVRSFVEQLPDGFATTVGERGIRLSGGQRQRIGIARALYKNASVLVLDEATSALDAATEASIMESIAGLDRELTIILIAHRLSTVAGCDTVYRLEAGRIVESGSYAQVVLAENAS
jgi:ABC-type bacteriocin/lantibiotic exporter with double-glycine peptidase domain